jgi:hypothetical protein
MDGLCVNVAASIKRDQIGSLDRKVAYNNQERSNMYPYLLEFTISRHVLSQPGRNSRYLIFDFGGNTGVLSPESAGVSRERYLGVPGERHQLTLAPPPPHQSLRWIFAGTRLRQLPYPFFEARDL